ncbi:MAG: right-handed parallel beta-helix repeat-containing protein [Acidobacteriota bacterium]
MKRALSLLISVLVFPVAAWAAEGRFPIWEPTTITTGGHYVLTQDVSALGGPAISIVGGIGDVEIDLNGFTVSTSPPGAAVIQANALGSVTLRNGTVRGTPFGPAVQLVGVAQVRLDRLKVDRAGADCVTITDASGVIITDNMIQTCGGAALAIEVTGALARTRGTIEGNQLSDTFEGIRIRTVTSMTLRNNQIRTTTGGNGITLQDCAGCLLTENVVDQTASHGIFVTATRGVKLFNNVITSASGHGIWLVGGVSDGLVLHNVVTGSTQAGIASDGERMQVDQNVLTNNRGFGLWFSGAAKRNTYGRNTMRGNFGLGPPCLGFIASCVVPDFCDDGAGNSSFGDNAGPIPGC